MAYSTDIKDYWRRAWGLEDRPGFKYGGSWADWKTNYEDQMTFEEYLQDDNIVKKPHFLDRKADGGRIGFKDKPLKNFKTVTVTQPSAWDDKMLTFDKKIYFGAQEPIPAEMETWFKEAHPGKKWENLKNYERSNAKTQYKRYLVRQESQKKKTFTGTDADIAKKLGINEASWSTAKSKKTPVYNRVIESIGEPQLIAEKPGHKTAYWDIDKLDADKLTYITTKADMPDRGGHGTKVLNNKELKKKFINAYKQGYGGSHILKVIDPNNTLGVNQEKYGSKVLSQLIADKEVSIREGGSEAQKIYWEQNRKPVDLEITKLNKFYTPGMSLEKVTAKLYPGWTPVKEGDSLAVVKDKTDKLRAASTRVTDYKNWLQGSRPGSTVLDNLEVPVNKKEIIKSIDANSDPRFKKYQNATERRYKFYQLDKLNNKPFGYYEGLNKKIFYEFKKHGLNYHIEHGTSLSQSLKKKIPWTSKFITFMKPKYNTQKIPLDMHGESGILKAYEVLENKNLTFEEKKNHKDVKAYNKAAKEYMLKTGNKIPTFSFNEKDVNKLLNDPNIDNQTKRQIKNSFTKQGWTLVNPGDQIETVVKFVKENGKNIPKDRKQIIISGMRNKLVNAFKAVPLPKGVKMPVGATAAALDFAIFNGLMGMPAPEAALGSLQWLLKNPEAAQKFGYALNGVLEGKMTLDQFFDENAQEMGGIFKDLMGLQMPTKVSEDDSVFTERMTEMDEAMKVPVWSKIKKDEDKENVPEKIDEDRKKEEPPEDPDLLPEILNLKDINLDEEKDIKISTEEDFKKLDEELKWFPFSKEDFEGGALDNKILKDTLKIIKGDIEFTGNKSFDEDAFLLTPPRGQQEIALKFLKQKLIEDRADSKLIEHISKLQKNLRKIIEKEGYYGDLKAESTGIGKALTEGFGYVKDLKRKKNATGGLSGVDYYIMNRYR